MDISLPNSPVPLFPLPRVFLFPHQVLPLHIFEPRYRQMVADLLDGPGRLVIGTIVRQRAGVKAGAEADAAAPPAVLPVAGYGEILRHERLDDGRYMIWVLGLVRVQLNEIPSDRPYRLVHCEPFHEIDVPEAEAGPLADELREATTARLKEPLPLPDTAPPALLADLLLQTLQAPQAVVARAFAEPSVSARARYVLRAAHRQKRPEGD